MSGLSLSFDYGFIFYHPCFKLVCQKISLVSTLESPYKAVSCSFPECHHFINLLWDIIIGRHDSVCLAEEKSFVHCSFFWELTLKYVFMPSFFWFFFPTTCLQQPRRISLLELESPLSSVFQTHLPLPGCWLEYAPHFLEFSEIKVITFLNQKPVVWCPHPALVTGVIYVVPICAHFLVMALRIRCFQLFKQTIPHQQAASNNAHTCQGGAEALQGKDIAGNRQTEQCSWPAPCSSPLRPLSHGQ